MLRNLYILSESGWGIKSSEIFADFFYVLSLLALWISFVFFQPSIYLIPSVEMAFLFVNFYYLLRRNHFPSYPFSILAQLLLALLLIPISFLHPVLVLISVLSGFLLYYSLQKFYSFQIFLALSILFFSFVWDFLFSIIGLNFRVAGYENLNLPFLQTIPAKTLGSYFSLPWFMGENMNLENFRSSFEYLSTYLLIGISWAAFRRPILFLFLMGWILTFLCFGYSYGKLPLAWVTSFAALGFIVHIAPGRNFYGSFFVTMISFLIFFPIAWMLGRFGGHPVFNIFIFFPLEAILVRVFLGK